MSTTSGVTGTLALTDGSTVEATGFDTRIYVAGDRGHWACSCGEEGPDTYTIQLLGIRRDVHVQEHIDARAREAQAHERVRAEVEARFDRGDLAAAREGGPVRRGGAR